VADVLGNFIFVWVKSHPSGTEVKAYPSMRVTYLRLCEAGIKGGTSDKKLNIQINIPVEAVVC